MADPLPQPPVGLAELLAFYAESGVDEALVEEAPNRLAAPSAVDEPAPAATQDRRPAEPRRPAPAPSAPAAPRPLPAQAAAVPDQGQIAAARERARQAATLEELREALAGFEGCNLRLTAKSLCFADGNPQADLMIVGEAPGREEDLEGRPFVGRSGQLLDRMLKAIGLDRSGVYIANTVPWRPPGNRTPTPLETEICRPFIERQIELAAPKVLMTVGNPSTRLLLNTTEGILKMRGRWLAHVTAGGTAIPAMPTLHPAYLLRTPGHKRFAWRDLLEIKAKLAALAG